MRFIMLWFLIALVSFFNAHVFAQEAIHTDSATLPSAGVLLAREQFQFARYQGAASTAERDIDEYTALTRLSYGVANGLALTLDVPLSYREINSVVADTTTPTPPVYPPGHHHHLPSPPPPDVVTRDELTSDFAFEDITVGFKFRLFNHDFGPIDTARFVVIGAIETPTGDDAFSSDSWDPIIGGAFTYIHDRHGFDLDLRWKFNNGSHAHPTHGGMGPDDALLYDAAYLFRLSPEKYSQSTSHAIYLLMEANGVYETNGDNEVLLAPGVMYEARNFALELSVQFPVVQNVDNRPETRFTVLLGVRVLL